jgi:hypothetical protein
MSKRPAQLPDRICEVCGSAFNRTRYANGVLETPVKFAKRNQCGPKCKYEKKRVHDVTAVRFCEYKKCGKQLTRNRHGAHLEHPADFCARRFCNDDCMYKSRRRAKDFPHKKCFHCKNVLEPKVWNNGVKESPYHMNRRNFCDVECYQLWLDEHWGEGVWKLLKQLRKTA